MGIVKDILSPLASAVTAITAPQLLPVVGLVNSFLGGDDKKKLSENSTVEEITNVIKSFSKNDYDRIMNARVEDENFTKRYIAMTNADQQKTRANIVLMLSVLLFIVTAMFSVFICYAVFEKPEIITEGSTWIIFATLTGVPATVIQAYFGVLRKEHSQRLGIPVKGFFNNGK